MFDVSNRTFLIGAVISRELACKLHKSNLWRFQIGRLFLGGWLGCGEGAVFVVIILHRDNVLGVTPGKRRG